MAPQHGSDGPSTPEGIVSLLDTDLYKLTMQCAVLKFFPDVSVAYRFTNRTSQMKLSRQAYEWLQAQVTRLGNVVVTDDEVQWLQKTCPYLTEQYLSFLKSFKLRPDEQVDLKFIPVAGSDESPDQSGDIDLSIHGLWRETILYEIPLLALISEAYFKFVDRDWNYDGQAAKAKQKGLQLLEAGCVFSEFGSRRRRDYVTHVLVMQGLLEARDEAAQRGWSGKLSGTSNVHLAMKYGLTPVGTVAHEWFMGIAAITDDYVNANEKALEHWIATFGRGVLGIALTDTFGTPAFLKAFAKNAPISGTLGATDQSGRAPTYAEVFTGVRQDSGDPREFISLMKSFFDEQGVTEKKAIVFSDSLDVAKCIEYKAATQAVGLVATFGVGTFLTNDFTHLSQDTKSVPLNIVIKLSQAEGRNAVKLSDNLGKNTGDSELVAKVKALLGYHEKTWTEGNEAHRWDRS